MKTSLTVLSALGLAAGSLMLAGPAQAITNPADNPRPVTVKGDDGKTYTDGEDTLPGYDDVECSYIPGAWYDFANNKVHYADGQSVTWTEWDRIAGYKTWLAKQEAGSAAPEKSPTKAPTKTPTKTAAPQATPAAPQGSAPKETSSASSSRGQGSAAGRGSAGAGSAAPGAGTASRPGTSTAPADPQTAADGAAAGDEENTTTTDQGATASSTASTGTGTAGSTTGSPDVVEAELTSGRRTEAAEEPGSAAGLLILGGLAAGAVALVGGWSVLGRRRKGAQL